MKRIASVIVVLSVWLMTGCSTSPSTNFYSLNSLAGTQGAQVLNEENRFAVRVARFDFPKYLDQQKIVTKDTSNRIEISEFNRWSGPFPQEFYRILGANLGVLLETPSISVYPSKQSFKPDYFVSGNVVDFQGTLDGELTLNIYWVISDASRQNELRVDNSLITRQVEGKGYDALVDAYGKVLEDFSRTVASAIREVSQSE